jgi:hypothetical protein
MKFGDAHFPPWGDCHNQTHTCFETWRTEKGFHETNKPQPAYVFVIDLARRFDPEGDYEKHMDMMSDETTMWFGKSLMCILQSILRLSCVSALRQLPKVLVMHDCTRFRATVNGKIVQIILSGCLRPSDLNNVTVRACSQGVRANAAFFSSCIVPLSRGPDRILS